MIESVTYEYQLIASGILPVWAGVLVAIISGVLLVWLITAELRSRKRQTVGVKVLKVNRVLIAILLAMLLVQPVLYISRITTRPAQLILAADRSRSMLRVDAFDATTLLNLATMLRTTVLDGRPVAPDVFNHHLIEHRDDLTKFRGQIASAAADLSQGIPVSAQAATQIEAQATEVDSVSKLVQADLAQLLKLPLSTLVPATQPTSQPGASPKKAAPDATAVAEKAASDLADLGSLLASAKGKPLTAETADKIVKAYDAAFKSADVASITLVQIQSAIDKQYLASLKPEVKKPLDELASKSRFEIARMVAKQAAEDPIISKSHRVVMSSFDALDANNASSHTDLYSVINDAMPTDDDAVLSGLVLFSDGQQNLPARPEVMRRLTGRGTPFIAAGVGSADALADIAVIDYQVPGVIQKDKKSTLIAKLKTQVPPDTTINLALTASDGKVVASATTKPGPNGKATVALDFRLPDVGQRILTLSATMDKPDAAPENDSVSVPVYVLDHQARALVIAKWPRWDIVYALQAMSDRPVQVDTVFWGESPKAPQRGSSKGMIPESIATLKRYQMVILDGAPFMDLKPDDSKMFQDFVTQESGSLVILDSDEKASYAGAWNWLGEDSATTKPATANDPPKKSAYSLAPAATSDGFAVTHLAVDNAKSRSIWSSLGQVRHAGIVPAQSTALIIRDDNAPVASLAFRGRGKIYRIGVADLFRTREWSGGQPMTRFLAGVVDDALIPIFQTPDAKVGLYPSAPSLGSPAIAVGLATGHVEFKPAAGASIPADLAGAEGGNNPTAQFLVPTVGNFDVTQNGTSAFAAQSIRPLSTEDVDFQLDAPAFTKIATQANGKYLPLAELPGAIKDLAPATERTVNVRPIELWNLTALLLLLAAMFTLDWYLRRKSGLVL